MRIKKPIALALIFVFLLVGCAKDSGTTQPKEPQTPKTESKYYTNPDYAEGTVFEYDTFTSEVRWIENEGQQIFALLSLPKSYSGNEKLPVLILCHGFNGTLAEYDNYLSHFTGAGFACLSFDYRGGAYRNSKSDGNILYMTLDTEISDTIAVTGYAKSLPCVDAENMVIVGHSQGGVIAGLSAVTEELKDSFKGMLLLAPAFEMIKSIGSEYIDGTVDIPETKICLGVKVSGDYIRSVVTHYDVYDEISAFQYPVKIFLGTKDGLFTEADMQRAIAAYGDDVSSYVIVQDGMHDFSSSIVSELFPKEIEPFLKGLVE